MSNYATCLDCGQTMNPGVGCTIDRVQIDGIGYPRIPFESYSGVPCRYCFARQEQFHHTNCAMETCPVCANTMGACKHKPDFAPYRPAPPAIPAATEDLWTLALSERGKVHLIPRIGAAFLMLGDGQQLTGLWLTREEAYRLAQALLTWVDET